MELIVRTVHEQCGHGGPTLTLARLKYWLIAGTRTVKKIIHRCVRCHRACPRPLLQRMGDLVPVPEDGGSLSWRNRWELCTSQYHKAVDRFKQEYLSRLQSRPKWCKANSNLRVGQLVLIKEENLAATEWRMGRITEVQLGADGLVRVAKLKTRCGEITRPITKLSPLSVDNPYPN